MKTETFISFRILNPRSSLLMEKWLTERLGPASADTWFWNWNRTKYIKTPNITEYESAYGLVMDEEDALAFKLHFNMSQLL